MSEYNVRTVIEHKVNELKESISKNEELLSAANEMVEYYKMQVDRIKNNMDAVRRLKTQEIASLLKDEDYRETQTQYIFDLIDGKVVKKKATQKINVVDKEKVINFIKNNEDNVEGYIEYREHLKWVDYKKQLNIAGNEVINNESVIVEGCEVEDVPESIELKI